MLTVSRVADLGAVYSIAEASQQPIAGTVIQPCIYFAAVAGDKKSPRRYIAGRSVGGNDHFCIDAQTSRRTTPTIAAFWPGSLAIGSRVLPAISLDFITKTTRRRAAAAIFDCAGERNGFLYHPMTVWVATALLVRTLNAASLGPCSLQGLPVMLVSSVLHVLGTRDARVQAANPSV